MHVLHAFSQVLCAKSADCYPGAMLREWRRRIPAPLKRRLIWLAGWLYQLKRSWWRLRAPGWRMRAGSSPQASAGAAAKLPAGPGNSVLASNAHGRYCVPRASVHRPVAQAIVQSRVWESDTLDLLRRTDPAGDVVHAGTYFGDFIPALANSREANAIVWAFEPNRENFECTRTTIELNRLENVRLTHAGLHEQAGKAVLATSNREGQALGGASRVLRDPTRARWFDHQRIELVALDDVVASERRVVVIHLDVEGHEQRALAGAMGTIARWRPLLVLETLPADTWIAERLTPLGYRIADPVDGNTVIRHDVEQASAIPQADVGG
jgi:FkbM family methyltransferase